MSSTDNDLIDLEAAIKLLGITRSTAYRWLSDGRLSGMRAGRQWRFRRQDIERFLHGDAAPSAPADEERALAKTLDQALADAGEEQRSPGGDAGHDPRALVVRLIRLGLWQQASSIHLEPSGQGMVIRLRLGGGLHTVANGSGTLLAALIAAAKSLVGAQPQERRHPQDGILPITWEGRPLTLRACFAASVKSELCTIDLSAACNTPLALEEQGLDEQQLRDLLGLLQRGRGLVVIGDGPGSQQGSGLYAAAQRCLDDGRKVLAIADGGQALPSGVLRLPMQPALNLHAAAMLRTAQRLDPDVILLPRLAPGEVAEVACTLACSGILVLAGMVADDAQQVAHRLQRWELPQHQIDEALSGIWIQRTLSGLCPHCATAHPRAKQLLPALRRQAQELGQPAQRLGKQLLQAPGCERCAASGHHGKHRVHQLLPASAINWEAMDSAQTATGLLGPALGLVLSGKVALSELIRQGLALE